MGENIIIYIINKIWRIFFYQRDGRNTNARENNKRSVLCIHVLTSRPCPLYTPYFIFGNSAACVGLVV